MKQLAQYQDGRLELQEVPAPVAPPGGILVQVTHSVISPGTEKMKVEQARMSLLEKARARPDQVRKVLDTARTLGWRAALEKVRNRLESPSPLGYSAAGVVVAVDAACSRFQVGDRVAVGGAECAHHAEFVAVPELLAARVPEGVELWQAAYTTLASISMEAVRKADARLGERVLVVGQGLVGLLATALLKASGARVMAVDRLEARLSMATAMGAERAVSAASSAALADEVRVWTEGIGVDAVLLCVAGKGAALAEQSLACLRDKGVLVIVGMCDIELPWKTAYMKDVQVRYSRSYGPGRYDPQYEWAGRDYPIEHVRWTEQRNFEACLHLMQTGALPLELVTTRRAAFAEAVKVYDELMLPTNSDVGVVLEYGRRTGILPVTGAEGFQPDSPPSACVPATSRTGILPVTGAEGFQPDSPPSACVPATRGTGILPVTGAEGFQPDSPSKTSSPDRRFIPYNPHQPTQKSRRHLPHWEQPGITQFITFRLADAIPQEQLDHWLREREAWCRQHPKPWDWETEALYHQLFADRMEQWLDAGAGSCLLAREDAARVVRDALHHFDGSRYVLDDYVVMPNHVHVLIKTFDGYELSDLMHSWKSFTAKVLKKLYALPQGVPVWQDERFDHAVRSVTSLEEKRAYIADNPRKARLTAGFLLGRGLGVVIEQLEGGDTGWKPSAPVTGKMPVPRLAGGTPASLATDGVRDSCSMEAALGGESGWKPSAPVTGGTPVLHAIGAGNFVRTMLLPHVRGAIELGTVVNATGLSARHVREKFGFAAAAADDSAALEQAQPGSAVLIGTRHHLHASQVLRALARGQHIFVEKPLCLTPDELADIDQALAASPGSSVMVGFNRRFAPATVELRKALAACPGPKTLAFQINAGPLAKEHWYANRDESGGRVLGEACHFFDYACHLLGSTPSSILAQSLAQGDGVSALVEFSDGSSAQILYSPEGDSVFPKESCRIFATGLVAELENFQRLTLYRQRKTSVSKHSSKGHAEEMAAWLAYLKGQAQHPLPYLQARQSMRLTFAALQSMRERRAVEV